MIRGWRWSKEWLILTVDRGNTPYERNWVSARAQEHACGRYSPNCVPLGEPGKETLEDRVSTERKVTYADQHTSTPKPYPPCSHVPYFRWSVNQ